MLATILMMDGYICLEYAKLAMSSEAPGGEGLHCSITKLNHHSGTVFVINDNCKTALKLNFICTMCDMLMHKSCRTQMQTKQQILLEYNYV